jgi:hypothetical protein
MDVYVRTGWITGRRMMYGRPGSSDLRARVSSVREMEWDDCCRGPRERVEVRGSRGEG